MKQENYQLLSRSLDADVDAMNIFEACKRYCHPEYRVLLESSEAGTNGSQQSMLLLGQALKIEARAQQVSITSLNDNGQIALDKIKQQISNDGFSKKEDIAIKVSNAEIILVYPDTRLVEEEAQRVKRKTPLDAIRLVISILSNQIPQDDSKLIIAGIAGYDLVDTLELLPEVESTDNDFPDYLFLLSDSQVIIDQTSKRAEIRQIIFSGEGQEYRVGQARGIMSGLETILKHGNELPDIDIISETTQSKQLPVEQIEVTPAADEFKSQVLSIKDAIAKGRVFQTVISRNFTMDCHDTTLAYQFLKQQNPSPYQFYLQMNDFTLFGASPESSLRYQHKDRSIGIMPIAGTRGRGKNPDGSINEELDARLDADLKLDKKELAEHLMLVDLARNDLARIAETGSRKVRELMAVYRYSAVMHMVSRIQATLRGDLDIFHACQSCFHMGTLTGAPKKEAMILIRETENRRRSTYGGAVGYFTGTGDMDTAIVIRSALVKNALATITAGAGIVADSTPEGELRETE
ncbi:MAG: anthranilate synthase component 1, partial [Gammaproteobacteria bacterium]|nr:anthranilate synthase component 1 [Gammaproteobacteria bacterium]